VNPGDLVGTAVSAPGADGNAPRRGRGDARSYWVTARKMELNSKSFVFTVLHAL
jgi:hypothetical protein